MNNVSQNKNRNSSTHIFSVGQNVLIKGKTAAAETETYRITATLPLRGNSPQYRVQNQFEHHERVVTQELIEPAAVSQASELDTLVEQTFGKLPDVSIALKKRSSGVSGARK